MSALLEDEATIGERLHAIRLWRGMTLAEVGGLAGLSAAYLSMVERGLRTIDRRSTISALAVALRVSETDLAGGPHLTSDRVQSAPHAAIPAIRVALQTNTLTTSAVDRARPLAELCAIVARELEPLRRICDYVSIGGLLPDVLDELHWHAASPQDEAAQRVALETLVDCCVITAAVAKELNYLDLAYLAAMRARDAAALLGDPVQAGKADFMWLLALPRSGSWGRSLRAAERAAGALEPYARTSLGVQVLGMITLTAALYAAALQDTERATAWLNEAGALAARVPNEPMRTWQSFSAENVGIWQVSIGLERGYAGNAIVGLAEHVDLGLFEPKASRRASFLLDVGRGLARDPRTQGDAVRWLRRAEEAAPQRVRNSPAARETVGYLLTRAKAEAGGRELRGMAARMGVCALTIGLWP
jgi:transcriptional regulator with XRE-family HTH domain